MRTQVPFSDAPVTMASNVSPILGERTARPPTCAPAVRPFGVVLLQRCSARPSVELAVSVRARRAGEGRLEQPLRDRGRDSGGWAPWSACSPSPRGRSARRRSCPGRSSAYSPAPSSLTTESDRSGKRSGSAARGATRNGLERRGVRLAGGAVSPSSAASATMRSQRSGVRTTRRIEGSPWRSRNARRDAVGRDHEVFDQLLGAVRLVRPQVGQRVAVEHRGRDSLRLELERAVRDAAACAVAGRRDPAARICRRAPARRQRRRCRAAGHRARRRRCCRRASRGCGPRAR